MITRVLKRGQRLTWQVQGAAMPIAGSSPVAMLRCSSSVPPPDKPAIPGREARMDTVFFHFKVSRGAAGTHRAFVQQPRVPSRPGMQPAVILLKICVWFGEVVPGGGKPTLIRATETR